jgi:sirohydrochlorin cobaltochelatase
MLIAIAHGSRSPTWRDSVERQFELLHAELGPDRLQLAYMDLSPPSLMDIVEAAVQHGVTKIRVFPLFLTVEGHVTKDIQPLLDEVRESFASMEIELLPPLGQQPLFLEMLRSLAQEESP